MMCIIFHKVFLLLWPLSHNQENKYNMLNLQIKKSCNLLFKTQPTFFYINFHIYLLVN